MYIYDVRPNPILLRSVMVFSIMTVCTNRSGIVYSLLDTQYILGRHIQSNSRQETLTEVNEGQTSVLCTAAQSYFIQPSLFQ